MERCCCNLFIISSVSLSRLSVVVFIIASAVDLLQMTVSLPVIKSSRIDTSGAGRASYETRERVRPGRYLSPHYQTLVNALEAVGVLDDANQSNCFVLENLTKEWRPGVDGVSMVEVSLQLRKFSVPAEVRGRERGWERRSKWSEDNSAATESDNPCLEWLSRTTTIASTQATTTKVTEGHQRGSDRDEDERSSGSEQSVHNRSASFRNKSSVAPEEPKAKEKPKHEEHSEFTSIHP